MWQAPLPVNSSAPWVGSPRGRAVTDGGQGEVLLVAVVVGEAVGVMVGGGVGGMAGPQAVRKKRVMSRVVYRVRIFIRLVAENEAKLKVILEVDPCLRRDDISDREKAVEKKGRAHYEHALAYLLTIVNRTGLLFEEADVSGTFEGVIT